MPDPARAHDDEVVLSIDRLDVYRLAVEFCSLAAQIRPASRDLRDQLERASASIVLNTPSLQAARAAPIDRTSS